MDLNQIPNISYHPKLVEYKSNINYDYWNVVSNLYYNQKINSVEYFYHLLHYINKNILVPSDFKIPFRNVYPHGTAIIEIYFDEKIFTFYSPFIKLKSESLIIPLFRKVSEINFEFLTLSQIFLKNNQLYFYYEDSMENNDPYKIFSILDEICYYSDYYDNYFIEKMNVEFTEKPKIKYFTEEEITKIYNQYIEILNEGIDYYHKLKTLNYYNNIKNIFVISLLKIHYLLQPQGTLRIEIDELINKLLQQPKTEIKEFIEQIYTNLENLRQLPKNKFKEYFYKVDYFLYPLKKADIKTALNYFNEDFQTLINWFQKEYFTDCTTYGTAQLLNFLDSHYVEENLKKYIDSSLKESAKKDWYTSANIIYNCYKDIMNNTISYTENLAKEGLRKPIGNKTIRKAIY